MQLAVSAPVARSLTQTAAAPRTLSIDVLRGLIMFTMVFVNDISGGIRAAALALLIFLAFAFRDDRGRRLDHSWWGILGLIGCAYLTATTAYLLLRREHLTALLGAAAVLMCLFFADRAGAFEH